MFHEASLKEEFALESTKLSFSESILAIMEKKNMSRVDAACRIGISLKRFNNILSGRLAVTFPMAVRIARELGVVFIPTLMERTKIFD